MRDVEPERGAERVALVLRREDALRDVAAAARLCARIPHRPPLHGERDDQHREREARVAEVGQERRASSAAILREQRVQPADLRLVQRDVRGGDHADHRQRELHEIRGEHAPEARTRRERSRSRAGDDDRLARVPSRA